MATLNKSRSTNIATRRQAESTQTYHGNAFKTNAVERLIERTVGAFWNENSFYEKGDKRDNALVSDLREVAKTDPRFPLQLAAWARNELYLRTTPQVILVESANIEEAKPYVRQYTPKIVKRADELAEVIAYQLSAHGKPIPNALKKGLADAFSNFDEYQLNKYDSDKGAVSLGDVLRLIARKKNWPVSEALRNYLVNDVVDADALPKIGALKALLQKDSIDAEAEELIRKSHVTWETLISKFGSSKENWERVIPNMGYMALLRNLRNFEEKGVDLAPVLKRISDPNEVKRSKQLPYRFYSAYKQVSNSKVQRAIAQAFEHSISNVTLPGATGVAVDHSGSMDSPLSDKSKMSYFDVGAVLGAIVAKKAEDSVVVTFGNHAKRVDLNPDDTMMTNIEKIKKTYVGHSTNAHEAFNIFDNADLDRIVVISDMQCYGGNTAYWNTGLNSRWEQYRKAHPKAYLYSLDVHAYGTKQIPSYDNHAVTINGWSDKVIDFMTLTERRGVMESEIKKW
jgi:60 kDa SS-A/Ro ribonucleoprotein